jgi:heme-degrading monooxygenase HmoA
VYRTESAASNGELADTSASASDWQDQPMRSYEGDKMAVLLTMDAPVSLEDATAVGNAMDIYDNPPDGLIAHVMTKTPDGMHVVDIWESREDFEKFNEERLMPATQQVMTERGISMDPLPQPTFEEAFDLVRGR